jgi:hypothetical protein
VNRALTITMKNAFYFWSLAVLALSWTLDVSAISFRLSPASLNNNYAGIIQFEITGIPSGDTVRIEQYPDLNGNGVIDPEEPLWRSFDVTDDQTVEIGGVMNSNVPRDENNWVTGQIRTTINANTLQINRWMGVHLFKVSSVAGNFEPAIASLEVQPATMAQSVHGTLTANDAPSTNGWVIAFNALDQSSFVAAMVDAATGEYSLGLTSGNYRLAGLQIGFIANQNAEPLITLDANQALIQNLSLTPADRQISGNVQDSVSGQGIPGIQLWASTANGWFTLTRTDQQGNFNLPVSADFWFLQIDNQALAALGYVGAAGFPAIDTRTDSVTNQLIELSKANALIYGTITDTAGRNVVGIACTARLDNQTDLAAGMSSIDGSYTLGVLVNQTNVMAQPDPTTLANRGFLIPRTNTPIGVLTETVAQNFVVQRATAYLRGQVIDQFSLPVAAIKLRAADANTFDTFKRTDVTGHFEIGVVGGTWTLGLDPEEASLRGYEGTDLVLTVTDYEDQNELLLIVKAIPIVLPAAPTLKALGRSAEGWFQFQFSSEAGFRYRIDRTTDLHSWTQLSYVEATSDTTVFTDSESASSPYLYYRVVTSP